MKIIPSPWRGLNDDQTEILELPIEAWNAELCLPYLKILILTKSNNKYAPKNLDLSWDLFSSATPSANENKFLKPQFKVTPKSLLNHLSKHKNYYANQQEFRSYLNGKNATVGIILRWPEAEGGATNQFISYAKELESRNVSVTFYGMSEKTPAWAIREKLNFKCAPTFIDLFQMVTDDVILISTVLDLIGLQFTANWHNKRIVHVCQGIETFHYGRSPSELYAEKIYFDILHSVPVGRISNSPHISKYFKDRFAQDCWEIPNAISDSFSELRQNPQKYPRNDDFIRILWIGDPRNYLKGFSTIKSAIIELSKRKDSKPVKLRLIVPTKVNPEELDLSGLPNIELSMSVPHKDMLQIYNQSDILVSTSLYEGFGMPIIEAMASSLPVITTSSMGLEGIIEHNKNALICPVCDSQSIAESIEKIINDKDLTLNLIKNGFELAKKFSKQSRQENLIKTFSDILDRNLDSDSKSDSVSDTIKFQEHKNKFSVLMPTYNQAGYIAESIQSVINQSYPDWELVICDDGSTDLTPSIIENFRNKDPRIKYIRKENGGTGSALNGALRASSSKWITWLSSDDLYEPNALEIFNSAINKNPESKFLHAHYYLLNDLINRKESPGHQPAAFETAPEFQVIKLLETNYVNGITICIDRAAMLEIGEFNEQNRNGQDYEMWLHLSRKFPLTYIPERTSNTRLHPDVGQVAFPEAGIYDSAAAALNFINKYSFAEYYPLLNLKNFDHAWSAILSGLQLAIKADAFIYQGIGFVPAFLERMLEWISAPEQRNLRMHLVPNLQALREPLATANLPASLEKVLFTIIDNKTEGFAYKAYEPFELMHFNIKQLQSKGQLKSAELIYKYLKKVKRLDENLLQEKSTIPALSL